MFFMFLYLLNASFMWESSQNLAVNIHIDNLSRGEKNDLLAWRSRQGQTTTSSFPLGPPGWVSTPSPTTWRGGARHGGPGHFFCVKMRRPRPQQGAARGDGVGRWTGPLLIWGGHKGEVGEVRKGPDRWGVQAAATQVDK